MYTANEMAVNFPGEGEDGVPPCSLWVPVSASIGYIGISDIGFLLPIFLAKNWFDYFHLFFIFCSISKIFTSLKF